MAVPQAGAVGAHDERSFDVGQVGYRTGNSAVFRPLAGAAWRGPSPSLANRHRPGDAGAVARMDVNGSASGHHWRSPHPPVQALIDPALGAVLQDAPGICRYCASGPGHFSRRGG